MFAGAAAFAGLNKAIAQGLVSPDERIVVINTGNGLKDVAGAMKSVEQTGPQPQRVAADIEALKRIMSASAVGRR